MSWRRFIASQMKDTPSQKTAVKQVTQKKKGKTEPNDEYRLFRHGENLIDECKTSPHSATSSVTLSVEWQWCFSRIQHSFLFDFFQLINTRQEGGLISINPMPDCETIECFLFGTVDNCHPLCKTLFPDSLSSVVFCGPTTVVLQKEDHP